MACSCQAGSQVDLAAWHGSSCDNTPWCLQNVAKTQNIPTFFMDRPYKIFAEHTVAYWRKQHEETDRLPREALRQEDGLRPPEGGG